MAEKKEQEEKLSVKISQICTLFESAPRDYDWYINEIDQTDKLTQDYLHKLELKGLNYRERAGVATQLMWCRQARREYKDRVQTLEPLVRYLDSAGGQNAYNALREILGKTRKIEESLENRVYVPRVLSQEEWEERGEQTEDAEWAEDDKQVKDEGSTEETE